VQLLEREPQLAALAEYAEEARRGDGRLVLVAGEAGVGKSTLVEHLDRALTDARWSWGVCDGLFTPRPLGPLFDLAGQLGGELDELCRAGGAREDLFSALLRQVSQPRALNVIVIEDVHWADEATIDLLRFLGRRLRDSRVLLMATYRDDGLMAGDPLRIALGDLATQRSTRRVTLAPLSVGAVRILAGGSGLDATELYRLTGGNPFYVTEALQAGISAVPVSARDAVLARVARMSAESREVLDIAALMGARVELDLLASVTTCQPPTLDELLASGLLAEDGQRLRFRHEIARLAVEQAVVAHRRAPIHGRILTALRLLGSDDDARMAFHAEAAGDGIAVLDHAPRAARRAAELASHREAAAQYERALWFSASAASALVASLYYGLARELTLIERSLDAIDAFERALALWRAAGNRLREGDTLAKLSATLELLARGPEAVATAEAAVAVLEPLGPTIELASAVASLACQRMVNSEDQAAFDLGERAIAIAEPLGALDVVSDALNTQGCSISCIGGDWHPYMRRALEIAVAAGLQDQAGRAFANIFATCSEERNYAEAEPYFIDGIAYCDEHDLAARASCLRSERTRVLERTGRWHDAVVLGTELLADGRVALVSRYFQLHLLGILRARRAEPGVWEYLDEATAGADASGQPQLIVPVRLVRAEAHWLQREWHLARHEAELADDASTGTDVWQNGEIGIWLRRTGSDRAPRGELAEPYRLQIAGDGEKAARIWAELGCPYDQAMALLDVGDEAAWREALRIFTKLGAAAAARVTRQQMRLAGVRSIPAGPRTATLDHPLKLTPREQQILDLMCSGHTNAQIAELLFISARTVAHHVSAVLAKLDAPTRGVAAYEAARLGLTSAARL
jgi:DNA-binding CsgD family transcriptional regulator/tetratricopeptide (TPR) repeat protein